PGGRVAGTAHARARHARAAHRDRVERRSAVARENRRRMGATLIETTGDRKGRVYLLEEAPLVVGRSTEADIVVPNALVSRKHARVSWDGQRYVVEDLGTRNGTLVNREQITAPHPLKDGDEIVLPGLVIVFRSSDETMMIGATPPPRVTTLT